MHTDTKNYNDLLYKINNALKIIKCHHLALGVVLISLALCADAVIGNVQEKALKAHKSSNTEMVSTIKPSP